MKIGDRVLIVNDSLFNNCEGYIIEIDDLGYLVSLYKHNDKITKEEINEYDVYFNKNNLELLPKLNIKKIRENKNTKIISTEESLEDIIPFYNEEDFE